MLADFRGKRVLLLQGPNGPLFRRVARGLLEVGAEVSKIHLNAADAFFYRGLPALDFRGTFAQWPAFLAEALTHEAIDTVFLFGDFRPYHAAAREVCREHDVELFVFEEGYLRPDYITIERDGVNTLSSMPNDPATYQDAPDHVPEPIAVKHAFRWSIWFTILNSLCVTLGGFLYPHYRHHRDVNTWRQALLWGWGFVRRAYYAHKEKPLLARIHGDYRKRYFLVGLQVHNDFQVQSSKFPDVESFIAEVVASFAAHASPEDRLVFKHHPADRAYRDYGKLILRLGREHAIEGRMVYVHDLHLPSLLRNARGTVVINSTVGLSSVLHHTPVKTLGEAVYDRMGLTADMPLDEFWQAPPEVDAKRYQQARRWLVHHNQANGSVWVALPGVGASGLVWPAALAPRKK